MFNSLFNLPRRGLACFVLGLVVWTGSAGAVTPVQRIISPGGIEAWLMEGHEAELITLKLSFEGGAVQEPADKLGVANLVAYYFNEGAGEMDSTSSLGSASASVSSIMRRRT